MKFIFPLTILAVALIAFLAGVIIPNERLFLSTSPEKAEAFYHEGVNATTIAERKRAFNDALMEFSRLEAAGKPNNGTGKLFYDMGNAYFQLEDFPQAILYYAKAKALMPQAEEVSKNLAKARAQLSISAPEEKSWLRLLLLDPWFPLPRRLQLFSLFLTLAAVFISISISRGNGWIRKGAFLFSFLAALMAINLAATRYLSPIEAIVMNGEYLRQNGGHHFPKVGDQPLQAGSLVEVIELSRDGNWVKVVQEEGALGFVPIDSIRLIR